MGASKLSLLSLDLNQQSEIKLRLEDPSRPEKDLGELVLSVILWPKTQEDKEQVSAHFNFSNILPLQKYFKTTKEND